MSKETMKLALAALGLVEGDIEWQERSMTRKVVLKAITALTAALAEQPAQQEPVSQRAHEMALRQWDHWTQYALELQEKLVKYEGGAPMVLNTSPPAQRTWVGLTDEEIRRINRSTMSLPIEEVLNSFARSIEDALRRKNT